MARNYERGAWQFTRDGALVDAESELFTVAGRSLNGQGKLLKLSA